jgi:hypothetical protein
VSAGLVATGVQGFWVCALVGLVFLAAVAFHLSIDQPQHLARLRQMFRVGGRLERQPAPRRESSLSEGNRLTDRHAGARPSIRAAHARRLLGDTPL